MNGVAWDLTGLLQAEVEALMVELGQPGYRGRQLFQWVQARRATSLETMTSLSRSLRTELASRVAVSRPAVARAQRATDGTRKFLFGLRDGEEIESVLIPDEDRLTACISTQVGCPLACRFCLTGLMGMRRNLTAAEIVGEVLLLQDQLDSAERISNLVLMGWGSRCSTSPRSSGRCGFSAIRTARISRRDGSRSRRRGTFPASRSWRNRTSV